MDTSSRAFVRSGRVPEPPPSACLAPHSPSGQPASIGRTWASPSASYPRLMTGRGSGAEFGLRASTHSQTDVARRVRNGQAFGRALSPRLTDRQRRRLAAASSGAHRGGCKQLGRRPSARAGPPAGFVLRRTASATRLIPDPPFCLDRWRPAGRANALLAGTMTLSRGQCSAGYGHLLSASKPRVEPGVRPMTNSASEGLQSRSVVAQPTPAAARSAVRVRRRAAA